MRHSCAAHNVGSSTARVCSRSRETLVCTHARARDSRKARAQFTSTCSVAVDKSGRCSFTRKRVSAFQFTMKLEKKFMRRLSSIAP